MEPSSNQQSSNAPSNLTPLKDSHTIPLTPDAAVNLEDLSLGGTLATSQTLATVLTSLHKLEKDRIADKKEDQEYRRKLDKERAAEGLKDKEDCCNNNEAKG